MDRWIDVPSETKYGRSVAFRQNEVYYDTAAKEEVRLSNGTCTLDHSSEEAYAQSHQTPGCVYAPSEAVALRVVGVTKTGDPIIGYTYRKVLPEDLNVIPAGAHTVFKAAEKVRRSRNAGRV